DKIKSNQKLYNFLRILETFTPNHLDRTDIGEIKNKITEKLIERAQTKVDLAAQAANTPPKAPAPQPAAPAPKSAAAASQTLAVGDIVEIRTGKYANKQGQITHMGGKFGVRVRVDLDGYGKFTKIAEYKKPDVSFTKGGKPVAPLDSDNPRGKDKQKRKERSDKGEKRVPDKPEELKPVEPTKTMLDYANDGAKAYELAPQSNRDMAHDVGILPLDEETRQMMLKVKAKMAKYWQANPSIKGKGTVPRWVKHRGSREYSQGAVIAGFGFLKNASDISGTPTGAFDALQLFATASRKQWDDAGFSYDEDIKPVLDKLETISKQNREILEVAYTPKVLNAVFGNVSKLHMPDNLRATHTPGKFEDALRERGYTADSPLLEIMSDPEIQKHIDAPVNPQMALEHAAAFAGKDPDPALTVKDLMRGLVKEQEDYKSGRQGSNVRTRLANTKTVQTYNDFMKRKKVYYRPAIKSFDDGTRWTTSSWTNVTTTDLFKHVTGDQHYPLSATSWNSYHANVFQTNDMQVLNALGKDQYDEMKNDSTCKAFLDNLDANHIAMESSARNSKSGPWKPTIFDKDMIEDLGVDYAGLSAGRRKDETDVNARKMAAKYVKARKTAKKASVRDKGRPELVRATLKKVDKQTHDNVLKRLTQSWDKSNHHHGFKVHGIYQVGGMELYKEFHRINKDRDNEHYVYHGTD
ncbi:MAG: hypothetical protein WBY88_09830, partial [Desulfosarcina sp.]